jgi:hypothetical protein
MGAQERCGSSRHVCYALHDSQHRKKLKSLSLGIWKSKNLRIGEVEGRIKKL